MKEELRERILAFNRGRAEQREIVALVEEAGGIKKTSLEQSDKLGYDWRRTYVGNILVYTEYVAQENPRGTEDNPITWKSGMVLIQNAFYVNDGSKKVWMGVAGSTAEWTDENFVRWVE